MRIAICDDDPLIIEELEKYIKQYFRKHHLSCPDMLSFSNGDALLADTTEKDIIFLDVEMPGVNGIYAGNKLRECYPNVLIFIVTFLWNIWMMPCVFMCSAIFPNRLTGNVCFEI